MHKVLILFGSSGSLGSEAIIYFSKQHYDNYYFVSRKPLELTLLPNQKNIVTGDLTIEENVESVFSQIDTSEQTEVFLFSSIGMYYGNKFIYEIPYSNFLETIKVNLNTSFLIAKHFSKLILKSYGGSICFTSAISSLKNEVKNSMYGISKNALNYLVKSLAKEGKEYNLSSNAVAPFIIDTKENREWVTDKSILITPENILKNVQHIFDNYKVLTGNIFELPYTIKYT